MAKTVKFKPEPYSQGPYAHAAHDAGGKLIGVPMPARERWQADLAAHAPGCGSPIDSVDGLPAEGIRCGQLGNDGNALLCQNCKGVGESREKESTASYPDDFQVILFDYLEPLGFTELPVEVPVKWVTAGHYRLQGQQMDYHPSDNRSNPAYLTAMRRSMSGGENLPPIIIDGDELIDGRHRLMADGRASVKAIDLADFKRRYESRSAYIVNTLLETNDFDAPENYIQHHIDMRTVEDAKAWELIMRGQRWKYSELADTLARKVKKVRKLNRQSSIVDRDAAIFGLLDILQEINYCLRVMQSEYYKPRENEQADLQQVEAILMDIYRSEDGATSQDADDLLRAVGYLRNQSK